MVDRSRWVKSWTVASRPAESRVFDLGHPAHPPAVRPGRKERKATCQLSKLGDTLEHRPVRSPALRGVCRARGKEEILWPAQRRGPDRTGLLLGRAPAAPWSNPQRRPFVPESGTLSGYPVILRCFGKFRPFQACFSEIGPPFSRPRTSRHRAGPRISSLS